MRILFITHLFPNEMQSTEGIFNLNRVQALQNLGCKVKVINPIGKTPPLRDIKALKMKKIIDRRRALKRIPFFENYLGLDVYHPNWYWLPKKFFWKWEYLMFHIFVGSFIKRIINDFEPDIIITSTLTPFATYSIFLKKYGIPIFSIYEGSDLTSIPKEWSGIESKLKIINKYVDLNIIVSKGMKNLLEKQNKILNNCKVIPNGFDNGTFYYNEEKERNKDTEKFNIISIGHLYYTKGHDILLKSLLLLEINFHLTIIGKGDLEEEYKQYIIDNNLKGKVNLIGTRKQTEISKYLWQSDLLCIPSRSESFGIVILEAMACGLPVVGSNVGGIPYLIEDDVNGYVFESENPEDLRNKLIQAKHKKWNHKLISKKVHNNYSWEKWGKEIMKEYNNINSQKKVK